jgi:serine/threonine-protein kinase
VRFVLTFPPDVPLLEGPGSPLVLSPDGRTLVFRTRTAGSSMLYRRAFDQLVPAAITGTERAALPFISPDGRWVAYFTGTELRKIPLDGGPPVTVATVKQPHGASWGPGDVIVLGAYPGADGLSRVSGVDGAVRPFATPDTAGGELSQRWPRVLDDGMTVLYTSWGGGGLAGAKIGVVSLETGQGAILPVLGSNPLGVVDGQLLFARADGALMAIPIDLAGRRVTGEAITLVEGVAIAPDGASDATLSASGVLAYRTGSATSRLVVVGADGAVRLLLPEPREYEGPRFSPDDRRVAVAISARPSDVWVYDIAAGTLTKLTSEADNIRPEWSPDGRRIAFLSNRSGEIAVWWSGADGSTPLQKVFESPDDATEVAVSADGSVLLYRANQSGGSYGIRFASLDDQSTPRPFFSTASWREFMPSLSPDGRWLAYVSDESGVPAVQVRPFPGPAARYLVSADGGSEPRWSPDGRRLFYRNGRKMLAATVSTVPGFAVTGREVLFEGSYATGSSHRNYDVSGDGREFLMLQQAADPEVVVVLNWLTELRRRSGGTAPK